GKRRLTGDALVQQAAKGIDVARFGRFTAFDQLGCQVVRRADDLPLGGQPGRVDGTGETEVRQCGDARGVEEDVRRLHVAVNDLALMQLVEAAAELRREPKGIVGGHSWYAPQVLGERASSARSVLRSRPSTDAMAM